MLYQFNPKYDHLLNEVFINDPFFADNSKLYKEYLSEVTAEWLGSQTVWTTFITFTFKDEVTQESAIRALRRFIRLANEIQYGNNYTRKVSHSYFQYACGLERQERGVIHFHMCIDRPINYQWVHTYWGMHHGFAWIEKITDQHKSLSYCLKYAVKDGDLFIYLK
jgi:hypothetical protein